MRTPTRLEHARALFWDHYMAVLAFIMAVAGEAAASAVFFIGWRLEHATWVVRVRGSKATAGRVGRAAMEREVGHEVERPVERPVER